MNTNMWNNSFIQENIKKLSQNGYNIIEPENGFLACGTEGKGRMAEIETIFEKTVEILSTKQILKGKRILITAGGTKEKIDPVRFITNNSSGKMGLALAKNASEMGADVTLISTFPVSGYNNIVTETAEDMRKAVLSNLANNDCVIMAAAVSDYRIKNYSEQKIKKTSDEEITLKLVKNPDILKEISQKENRPLIVGFCAESENLIDNANLKIKNKGCDYIIANDISKKDIGFNSDNNEVYIINKTCDIIKIEKDSKNNVAKKILEIIFG